MGWGHKWLVRLSAVSIAVGGCICGGLIIRNIILLADR